MTPVVDGWSHLTVAADARVVHVSTSGSDANDGLSPARPKATISAGLALLRHGWPDRLLLRKGDEFGSADVPSSGYRLRTSGRSALEPMVVGAYGTGPRPIVRTGGKGFLRAAGGGGTPPLLEHVAVVGLHLDARPRADLATQNPTALRFQTNMADVLVEDCRIEHFAIAIAAQLTGGLLTDVRIRRNCISDSYAGDGSHAQGLYCDEVDGLLIEENVIDHGGWSEQVEGDNPPDIFKHNIYVQGDARNVTLRRNILASASSHGAQLRSGGVAEGNLFVRNAVGLLMAGNGTVTGNVFLDGRDITDALPRRQALHVQNVSTSLLVARNVIANSTPGSGSKGISILPLLEAGQQLGVRNVILHRNVVANWGGECLDIRGFGPGSAPFEGFEVSDCTFLNEVDGEPLIQHAGPSTIPYESSGNRLWSEAGAGAVVGSSQRTIGDYLRDIGDTSSRAELPAFPNTSASLASYHAFLGRTATHEAFMAEALRQSRDSWRDEYAPATVVRYFRRSFAT